MLLDPIQQAHEDAITASLHELNTSATPAEKRRSWDRARALLVSRDPEVILALELARLERVGL